MALIVCPECGKQVSDQAETCPNCGYPIPKYIAEQKRQAELAAEELKKAEAVAVAEKVLPSVVGIVRIKHPVPLLGAPHSSTAICPVSAQNIMW